jgi:hypothetical protein
VEGGEVEGCSLCRQSRFTSVALKASRDGRCQAVTRGRSPQSFSPLQKVSI